MSTIESTSASSSLTTIPSSQQQFDLQSETVLFDCLAQAIPISYYKPFSMLNTHVLLKREANLTLPIDTIEKRVEQFYDLKVLAEAKEVPPIIPSRKIEYFKLPAEILGQFEAKEEVGKTEKQKKKKKK